jgi:hypothetical protein
VLSNRESKESYDNKLKYSNWSQEKKN